MGAPLDPLHPAADRAVVEEAQVVVAVLSQELVGLVDVDLAAHQQRELALACHGECHSSLPGKLSNSSSGMPAA